VEDLVESISGVKHAQNNLRVADAASGNASTGASNWSAVSGSSTGEGGTLAQSGTIAQR